MHRALPRRATLRPDAEQFGAFFNRSDAASRARSAEHWETLPYRPTGAGYHHAPFGIGVDVDDAHLVPVGLQLVGDDAGERGTDTCWPISARITLTVTAPLRSMPYQIVGSNRSPALLSLSPCVAAGGVGTIPWRLSGAENTLVGEPVGERAWQAAADRAVEGAQPLTHNAFKVELLKRTVFRALVQVGGT
jgi:CO dehydrogenase flavoprotein C-terminal domain